MAIEAQSATKRETHVGRNQGAVRNLVLTRLYILSIVY